jgi:hypothetical protein
LEQKTCASFGWRVAPRKNDRQMRKKQQRASSAGDAVGAGSACGLLLWLLYQNRVTEVELLRETLCSIQDWG